MPRLLCTIASEISRDWKPMSVHARPYVEAMSELETIDQQYYCDSAKSIVLYFLANATYWKGPTARRVKLELRKMAGV